MALIYGRLTVMPPESFEIITIFVSGRAHGQTYDNVAGVASGWRDPVLTEQGRMQAKELGLEFLREHFDVIFTSDHQRTYETALLMFEGRDIPIIQDHRLRTIKFGNLEGRQVAEWEKLRPKDVSAPFPEGESYVQMAERFRGFLKDLETRYNGKRVMIVANRPRMLQHRINGAPLEEATERRALDHSLAFEYEP